MCAICGIFIPSGIDDQVVHQVIQMRDAMTHRGPDDAGIYHDADMALGVRRLSIIDVAGGHQPISNEDGTVWVVSNGEIYNFKELRQELESKGHHFRTRSDTEVIVHLYEEDGDQFVKQLRGMFGLALWDKRNRRLLLARDRMGIKPLYYAARGETLLFASELKALQSHPEIRPLLDLKSMDQYLFLGYVPAPRSILQDVLKLPPGHFLVVEKGRRELFPYWRLPAAPPRAEISEKEASARVEEAVLESVRVHLESDVPVGIFLSGGLDSSLILWAMRQHHSGEIPAFTIGFEESSFDEATFAAEAASACRAKLTTKVFRSEDLLNSIEDVARASDEPMGTLPSFQHGCFPAWPAHR